MRGGLFRYIIPYCPITVLGPLKNMVLGPLRHNEASTDMSVNAGC